MIKLGIKSYPFLSLYHDGPKVFMNRLVRSFKSQNLFKIRPIYFSNYDVGLFSVTKGDIFNIPYFLRLDGLYIDKKNTIVDSKLENSKIFKSIKNAKALIYQSSYCKKIAENLYPEKIIKPSIIINNGVPLEIFKPEGNDYRSKLNLSSNDRVLITSAHWRRHKRLEETIKLINILNKNNGEKYKLIVLGQTDLFKNYKNNKNIIFSGEIQPNSLPAWYRSADVYIHLAWIEPAGNTQNEAMACGLPVVCSNNGGLKDTVIKANGGIVSNTDEDYNFESIDYYNPPEPNYINLSKDVISIFDNLKIFKSSINFNEIDINIVANKYANFIKQNI